MNRLLEKIVRDSIKKMLFEKQHVSDTVLDEIYQIMNKLDDRISSREFDNTYKINVNWHGILVRMIRINTNLVYAHDVTFFIYELDKEKYIECINDLNLDAYNDNGHIVIRGYTINGDLSYRKIYESLSHELNHELQSIKSNGQQVNDYYSIALDKMENASTIEELKVAQLIYFFDKNEISSYLAQLYQELRFKWRAGNVKESTLLRKYDKMCRDYNEVLNYPNLKELLSQFNLSIGKLKSMIDASINTFETKSRKIIYRVKLENGLLENKHKHVSFFDKDSLSTLDELTEENKYAKEMLKKR